MNTDYDLFVGSGNGTKDGLLGATSNSVPVATFQFLAIDGGAALFEQAGVQVPAGSSFKAVKVTQLTGKNDVAAPLVLTLKATTAVSNSQIVVELPHHLRIPAIALFSARPTPSTNENIATITKVS